MANFVYLHAKYLLGSKQLDLVNDDIRCLLVGVNTTCNTESNVTNLAGFATLDEITGTGYSRKALTTKSLVKNTSDQLVEWRFDDILWTALDAGITKGALLYLFNASDALAVPILWYEDGGFPVLTNADDFQVSIDANGGAQIL